MVLNISYKRPPRQLCQLCLDLHVPPSLIILYVAPITWRVKNYVFFGLQLQVLQWANLKSEDTFVILGPNGLGSFKTWLTEALISSSILAFKKGFLGVLSGPWIGTCMVRVVGVVRMVTLLAEHYFVQISVGLWSLLLDVLWVLCAYVFLVPTAPRHEFLVNRLTK